MQEESERRPKHDAVGGSWQEGVDYLGRHTWSLSCDHGAAVITDEATLVPVLRDGAHYCVEVIPDRRKRIVDFKWRLTDVQAFALEKLGFRVDEYRWAQDRGVLGLLKGE